jgi:hypothetical protein
MLLLLLLMVLALVAVDFLFLHSRYVFVTSCDLHFRVGAVPIYSGLHNGFKYHGSAAHRLDLNRRLPSPDAIVYTGDFADATSLSMYIKERVSNATLFHESHFAWRDQLLKDKDQHAGHRRGQRQKSLSAMLRSANVSTTAAPVQQAAVVVAPTSPSAPPGVHYVCQSMPEESTVDIDCGAGNVVSDLPFVSFGAADTSAADCAFWQATDCHLPSAAKTVEQQCSGQQRCSISVHLKTFGGSDPCPGKMKMLAVRAECMSREKFATRPAKSSSGQRDVTRFTKSDSPAQSGDLRSSTCEGHVYTPANRAAIAAAMNRHNVGFDEHTSTNFLTVGEYSWETEICRICTTVHYLRQFRQFSKCG